MSAAIFKIAQNGLTTSTEPILAIVREIPICLGRYLFAEGQGSAKDVIHAPQDSIYKEMSNKIAKPITQKKGAE